MDRRTTRMLSAGIFGAGLFYASVVLFEGRYYDPTVYIALAAELLMVYASLTQEPPTKTWSAVIGAVAGTYVSSAMLLGLLNDMVIMVAGGLGLYLALMSNPTFPLTKRAMATGVGVGVVMTFLGIYLALKLGVIYFVGAEMLGALILTFNGRYTKEENTIVVAISNTSSMIVVGVLIAFPAIAIFEPAVAQTLITFEFIVTVTGLSAVFGVLLLLPFRTRFEREPWPQVRPQAECIICIGADAEARKKVGVGIAASAGYVGATKVTEAAAGIRLAAFPNAFTHAIPDWIGLTNSPLIAAIGYFVGWKRVMTLLLGSALSLTVWVVLEGASPITYADHLRRPEILYMVLGVFALIISADVLAGKKGEMTPEQFEEEVNRRKRSDNIAVIDTPHKSAELPSLLRVQHELFSLEEFKLEFRRMVSNPGDYLRSTRGNLPPWLAAVSMAIFMAFGIVIFSILAPFPGLQLPWLLFVIGSPLALISAYFTARAVSETGMLAGYVSDIVAIPAILFFRVTFQAITSFMTMLGVLQDAALALLVHLKLGSLTGVRGRDIFKAVVIGLTLATFGGSMMIYAIYRQYGFGGTDFPSPAAQLFGFLVKSLQSLGQLRLPGMDFFEGLHPVLAFLYLLSYGVAGYIVAREVNRRGLSAMSLAVGLLVPPATSLVMLFGAAVDYRARKGEMTTQEANVRSTDTDSTVATGASRVLSGVVAGEAIVVVIWVLATLFVV
ncbi:MAG: OPT/YSL family transporter [Candidatus Thorarchaeota archaeon]|nr:OPT/YSL family transporter [Candidatus Thorarchaeota archaeon]